MKRIFFFTACCLIVAPHFVMAQVKDPIAAQIRVEQLERRLMMMEQKLFSGDGEEEAQASTMSGRNLESSDDVRNVLADFEVRLQQLENEWQKLYGSVEEMSHGVEKLTDKIELIAKDLDLRVQDLERGAVTAATEAMKNADKTSSGKTAGKKAAPDITAGLSADDVYQKAYGFLTAASYEEAEKWFKAFLARYSQNPLADNAYYWLGEIYLVQSKPEEAVVEFSNGLGAFPQGNKASAHLLKMGVAFHQMERKDHAKSAWNKLLRDFPHTPEAQKARKRLEELN